MYEVVFWLLAFIVLYVYFGYPLLLLALTRLRPAPSVRRADVTPTVSLIVPAYNEEKLIAAKLENSLALDYPHDTLEVIVVSDGSTDGTNEIVRTYQAQGVKLVALLANEGKSSAENAAVAQARGEILYFSDADAMLRRDAIRQIVANFADSSVGCVVGQVTYVNQGDTTVSEGEGFYWRYELFLRSKESGLGNFAMGTGAIMAVRRSLFHRLDPDVSEDFVLPMLSALKGYRVVYEPEAISETVLSENTPATMYKSKVTVTSLDLRGLALCRAILNPFRYPLHAWGLISHKLLRWLIPYFLLALLVVNLFLVAQPFYALALAGQVGWYGLAWLGYRWPGGRPPRLVGVPFSFCLVNLAALAGVAWYVSGKKSGRWQPVRA